MWRMGGMEAHRACGAQGISAAGGVRGGGWGWWYKDFLVRPLQLSPQPKTVYCSHPRTAILCSHACSVWIQCVEDPRLPFSTRRVRADRDRRGARTPTALITHMHVAQSQKPSAEPPHTHTYTQWFGMVSWPSLKRFVDRGSRESQGNYKGLGSPPYSKLFSLLWLYCII